MINTDISKITQDLLRELFDYRDGELYWKVSVKNIKIGDRAGNLHKSGYCRVGINNKTYLKHRLIFLYHHGYLPEFLDHIDGDPSNDDIDNIRIATKSQNAMNRKKKLSSSVYKGVSWKKSHMKWVAQIHIDGARKHIGIFDSEIDAAHAYDKAAIAAYGMFAKLNFIV